MGFVSPLSCSTTSGKSDLWCDANLSCLRISTPQKPWSPTVELKTCWQLTMDSRTLYLPAPGSAAPSTFPRHGHPFCPGVGVTRMSHAGHPSVFPTMSLPTILICSSSLKPPLPIFLLSQVFSFILWAHPHHVPPVLPFPPMSLLPCPAFTPCARCQCGIWEHGLFNTGSFIPSWNCVLNWLDKVGKDWCCLRLTCRRLFGFLFCQREQILTPMLRWKNVPLICCSTSSFFLLDLMDSCQCQDCCVLSYVLRESNRKTCLFFFTDVWDFFSLGHQTKLRPVLSLVMSRKDGKETRCPVDIWHFLFLCHMLFFICLLPYV